MIMIITTLNVKGLNSPPKHISILVFSCRYKIDIALLQENHLKPADVARMPNKHYKPVVASGEGSLTKGVLILMRRQIALQTERAGTEYSGSLAYCCTTIQGQRVACNYICTTKICNNFFSIFSKRPTFLE